jgi:hypothetical protein
MESEFLTLSWFQFLLSYTEALEVKILLPKLIWEKEKQLVKDKNHRNIFQWPLRDIQLGK